MPYFALLPARALIVAGAVFAASFAALAQEEFLQGGHYELLNEVQPVQTGDKIEVVEMFWYGCPHCYRLEPHMQRWLKNKPENAAFVPMPAVLNKNWAFDARAYYVFEALNLDEQLHTKFFDAIHDERKKFRTIDDLADWIVATAKPEDEQPLERQTVLDTAQSFAVENRLQFAAVMSRKYGITGVPAIIVDGRYRTSVSLAGGHARLIKLIDFLVNKAQAARG